VRQSERKFSTLFETSPVALVVTQPSERRIIEINDAALRLIGLRREEAIGAKTPEIVSWSDRAQVEAFRERGLAGERVFGAPTQFTRRDGQEVDALVSGALVEIEGEPHFVVSLLDVTEQRRAEQARKQSDARYRALFETAMDGIVIVSPQWTFVDINPAGCRYMGYAREELVGKPVSAVFSRSELESNPIRPERQWTLVERTLTLKTPEGKHYKLNPKVATLVVRPRGWHLHEKHITVEGEPISGSLFDAGLYLFHCGKRLVDRGSGPYFYLPKMESHLEARLWADVFKHAEAMLKLGPGAVKCTVLIETILAAFEMDEILYELLDHSCALNAGRWDYLFSTIKKFRHDPRFVLPDRAQLTMTVPFMRAYTELLVKTCHARGAHAIGGMAAFIPNRKDPQVTEVALSRVREDKQRESKDGFDGTWVAHPDLVAIATDVFDGVLGKRPNQVDRRRDEVGVAAKELLDFGVVGGTVTEVGVRSNVGVGIRYLESWLRGVGAAAINNLMEDAATAEIARSQVWQWLQRRTQTREGTRVTAAYVKRLIKEETAAAKAAAPAENRFDQAADLFERLALSADYEDFLTLLAYEHIK